MRVADQSLPFSDWPPGAYGGVMGEDGIVWHATTPNGLHIDLSSYDVIEHPDGTISVSPSIVVAAPRGAVWSGWLTRGVWREC